jgi:hypothetical protein
MNHSTPPKPSVAPPLVVYQEEPSEHPPTDFFTVVAEILARVNSSPPPRDKAA